MTERSFHFAVYFAKLPRKAVLVQVLDDLAQTMPIKINATFLRDDTGREKKPRYSKDALAGFLEDATWDDVLSMLLCSRVRGEDNRVPRCSVHLNRVDWKKEGLFALTLTCDAENGPATLPKWLEVLKDIDGLAYGCGSEAARVNLDFSYWQFLVAYAEDDVPGYLVAKRNCKRASAEPASFYPVIEGRQLRSVFAVNLVTPEVLARVDAVAGQRYGQRSALGAGLVLWRLPDPDERRDLFGLLRGGGLVFDDEWLDIQSYLPSGVLTPYPNVG